MKYINRGLTSVCPVVSRIPDPADAKFMPLRNLLLRDDPCLIIERKGGGLLL